MTVDIVAFTNIADKAATSDTLTMHNNYNGASNSTNNSTSNSNSNGSTDNNTLSSNRTQNNSSDYSQAQHKKCLKQTMKLLNSSPLLVFMSKELEKINAKFAINCMQCPRTSGFDPATKDVVVCENNITTKNDLEKNLAHELVHVYDDKSVKMDYSNSKHVACSEIRAISLSGECSFLDELKRGYFDFGQHFQQCVKRRAYLGVLQSNSVSTMQESKRVVDAVFEDCFNDTAPFDEIY